MIQSAREDVSKLALNKIGPLLYIRELFGGNSVPC
jgi:hypothetical protein